MRHKVGRAHASNSHVMPSHSSCLRRYRGALLVVAVFLGAPLVVTAAEAGQRLLDRWRVRRMSDLTSMPSPAYRPLLALATSPDVSLEDFEGLLGEHFDPGEFDEVDVAGNGRILAYTSLDTTARRDVVLSFEGRGGESDRFERLSVSDGDTEHPSIDLDRLGYRVAVRGTDATGLGSDIYLVSRRKFGDGEGATLNVTDLPRIGNDPDPDDDIDPVTVDGEA